MKKILELERASILELRFSYLFYQTKENNNNNLFEPFIIQLSNSY